jgi:hypothetical protein
MHCRVETCPPLPLRAGRKGGGTLRALLLAMAVTAGGFALRSLAELLFV